MTDPRLAEKRAAAERAAQRVAAGMAVGLGTGSTAALVVEALGRRLARGELTGIVGVPTSTRTRDLAAAAGIPLATLEERPVLDLTIDGADEVDPRGDMIKGHGGALLWEKIVAAASQRYVIVVDRSKLVSRLGERFAVPVEVVRFGWNTHHAAVEALGGTATLRRGAGGEPFVTDAGHVILDCHFAGGIEDPAAVHAALRTRPGIVETGLFLGMAPEVIVGGER